MSRNPQAIPTTVINGFLGAGKTTIINHLIDQLLAQKQQVVYVKNEIGDTDLDAQLLRGKNIITKDLLNGCICCTLVGPFLAAITELVTLNHPDRIIIESAGSADPASIALMVENHPLLKRDGVILIIDVLNFDGYDQISEVIKRQAEFTDLIVFNKVELADEQRKIQVVGYVRELNEKAPIVEAKAGQISADLIFGLGNQQALSFAETDHNHTANHEIADEIEAFTYQSQIPIEPVRLKKILANLPKNIFRVKGLVNAGDQVQLVNQVFQRTEFSPAPISNFSGTKLIFIGYLAKKNQHQIVNDLENR